MIKDRQVITRLNRILPEWRRNNGASVYSDTNRTCARLAALKNLNLLHEIVFECDVNGRCRLSDQATSNIWALVIFLDNCLQEAIKDRDIAIAERGLEATG